MASFDHHSFVRGSAGILVVLFITMVMFPGRGTGSALAIGDFYSPILVPLGSDQLHLFFIHEFLKYGDVITAEFLQTTWSQGIWSEAIPFTTPSSPCAPNEGISTCRLTWSSTSNNPPLYFVDYGSKQDTFRLKTYQNGMWSDWSVILDKPPLKNSPIHELQVLTDSKNQLHLVWEQFYPVSSEPGSGDTKYGLLYSVYQGSTATQPEPIPGIEYPPSQEPCPACTRHFLARDPMTDRLYLAWFNGATFFTARTLTGWADSLQVATTPYSTNLARDGNQALPDLPLLDFHIDSQGALYFFFSIVPQDNRLLIVKYMDGEFSSVVSDQPAPFKLNRWYPARLFDVECDSTDTFHIAYIQPNSTAMSHLYYQTFKEETGFSSPVQVADLAQTDLDLALDPTNTPHLVWGWRKPPSQGIFYAQKLFYTQLTEEGWLEPIQITLHSESPSTLPEVRGVVELLALTWGISSFWVARKIRKKRLLI